MEKDGEREREREREREKSVYEREGETNTGRDRDSERKRIKRGGRESEKEIERANTLIGLFCDGVNTRGTMEHGVFINGVLNRAYVPLSCSGYPAERRALWLHSTLSKLSFRDVLNKFVKNKGILLRREAACDRNIHVPTNFKTLNTQPKITIKLKMHLSS